ncbi:O-antigen ligase family protein [Metabacillus indicus]|nr:O-antigen ligase family protein [Metabacillus indicus]
MMLSWTAFNEWLPKRAILLIVYIYFIIKIALYIFLKKSDMVVSITSLIIVILCFISFFWSELPNMTLTSSLYLLVESLIMMYMANEYKLKHILKLFFTAGYLIAIFSFAAAILAPSLGIDNLKHIGAWEGIFTHKNNLAGVMVFYILIGSFLISIVQKSKWKMFIIFISLFQVILIVLSQSTTSFLLLILTYLLLLVILIFKLIKNYYLKMALSVYLALFVLSSAMASLYYLPILFGYFGKDTSFTGRDLIWEAGLSLIDQRWLTGYGYMGTLGDSSFRSKLLSYINFEVGTLHSGYLESLAYIGYLGCFLIVIGLIVFIIRSIRQLNSNKIITFLPITFLLYSFVINTQESAFIGSEFGLIWGFYVLLHTILILKKTNEV